MNSVIKRNAYLALGAKIKEIRISAGLTQKELSESIGVTPRQVRRYEADEQTPTNDILQKIALACGYKGTKVVFFK